MNKENEIKLLKELEEKKAEIEDELSSLAKKGDFPGGYQSLYPEHDKDQESNALAVEEMGRRKATEYELEKSLNEIESAIKKIKEGGYGVCEKCSVDISLDRLKVMPVASFCINCASKNRG